MPTSDSPVVLSRWVSPDNQHLNSRYGELIWPLAPLIDNPGTSLFKIHWLPCPEALREQVKLPAWTMINGELRPTFLRDRGVRALTRTSASDMRHTIGEWIRLARWLDQRGITDLAECTENEWRRYPDERWKDGVGRDRAEKVLGSLTDLWAFDQLSARPTGIAQPPWDSEGIDDFLPAADGTTGRENATEPLDPKVLGPLLVWAIRFVDDFADDIIAAWKEHRRLSDLAAATPSTPAGSAALAALAAGKTGKAGVPAFEINGTIMLARTFIAATTGASLNQINYANQRHGLADRAAREPAPCPMDVPVTGRINDRPWREYIDFTEAMPLMRHLGTAAMIIILYLTGMRPQEAQGLRSGCCPDPEPAADGSPGRHLIRSHHFKNVTDDDGHHVSAGAEREIPWVAITPVVHAIRVLERFVPAGEFLFNATRHDFLYQRKLHGVLKTGTMNQRIEDFVDWVNHEAVAQGVHEQTVPHDPLGAIGVSRFRRTLAWHVARQPGGLIALAIQYGHMRTLLDARTSSGYASRSRHGIHGVLDVETALAAADTAAKLRDRVAAGENISGPAASRALTAAATTPRFEGRIVPRTFARKAATFLARDGVVLYDNPEAFLICAFKHDNALCDPEPGATAPRQYACQSGCGNAVRTDSHAQGLRDRADEIEYLAAFVPGPLGKRLRFNADKLRAIADTHQATARSAEALT
ncbi:integrase [Streptomyces sp. SLBN-115]|uniref:integrase n=1 Tax=Streptomyces sp. SLBN-115 TaxID=2768453 RepID=UPI001F48B30C|nr:integrase [Streptomyces sp. SLBN-115]